MIPARISLNKVNMCVIFGGGGEESNPRPKERPAEYLLEQSVIRFGQPDAHEQVSVTLSPINFPLQPPEKEGCRVP